MSVCIEAFLRVTVLILGNPFIGADNLVKFHKWKKWKKIPKLAKLVVFARQNYSAKALNSIASKKLGKQDWLYIPCKRLNISSSLFRKF